MPNPNLNLKKGEAVGVVYKRGSTYHVHDGVLKNPIADGNHPPSTVSIVHYQVINPPVSWYARKIGLFAMWCKSCELPVILLLLSAVPVLPTPISVWGIR